MPKLYLVIAGNGGAGKDTAATFITQSLWQYGKTVHRDAYAWALKQIVHLKYGIPLDILNADKTVKESTFFFGKTVRTILQEEGEHARKTVGPTVWSDRCFERVTNASAEVALITDARHPQEEVVDMRARLASRGFAYFVRVVNPRVPVLRGHPSEDLIADAPDSIFDEVLLNDGSLDNFASVCDFLVARLKGKVR